MREKKAKEEKGRKKKGNEEGAEGKGNREEEDLYERTFWRNSILYKETQQKENLNEIWQWGIKLSVLVPMCSTVSKQKTIWALWGSHECEKKEKKKWEETTKLN